MIRPTILLVNLGNLTLLRVIWVNNNSFCVFSVNNSFWHQKKEAEREMLLAAPLANHAHQTSNQRRRSFCGKSRLPLQDRARQPTRALGPGEASFLE